MIMSEQTKQPTISLSLPILRGETRINEPMRKHTSWRAGGAVKLFYRPANLDDLATFLQGLPLHEPVTMIGLGSNLLVRDGGLPGTVIALHGRLTDLQLIQQDEKGGMIYVGAGATCAKVARFAACHDLAGAEFLAGIPGTVGGALAMNAGCYGSETWQIVESVQVIDRSGQQQQRSVKDYQIGYRQVKFQPTDTACSGEAWFVGGWLRLKKGGAVTSYRQIKELLMKRINSQPLNLPNAGSVFRNPPDDYAARLIELCGLKGFCVGGAMVSPKHANFIVNTGNATATDIEAVITKIMQTVKEKTNIELQQEVKIMGDFGRPS